MTPRDLSARRALVIGRNAVEIMDVDEYLCSHGWAEAHVVADIAAGVEALANAVRPFDLVVLAAPHADPSGVALIRSCVDEACPVIVINGALATTQAGQVVLLNRPFMDSDLETALRSLGLSTP